MAQPITLLVGLAALWAGLALWNPTTTWHLAPAIVTAAPAVVAHGSRPHRMRVLATGTAVAAVVGAGLAAADALRGPTLLPVGGPGLETVTAVAVGVVVGWLVTRRTAEGAQVAGRTLR